MGVAMKFAPVAAAGMLFATGLLVGPELPPVSAAVPAAAVPAAAVPAAAAPGPRVAPAAIPSNPVDYAYDGAGQLRGVTQAASGGQSARYGYDAGGNVVSIERFASSTLTVSSVVPSQAPAGATVTISGTGFVATASANTVRFNGTAATVTAASTVRLTVTVPAGATSGAVTVTTAAGTATSAQAFTVGAALPVPTVTALSPTRAAVGATVTVTGTGFDTSAGGNIVSFGRTRARVTAATATRLTVTVPEAAGSGRVTVATAGGSVTSGSDFVVVPTSYAATAIANTGVLPVGTGSAPISVPVANQVAVWRFSGTKGQRLSLGLTGETFTTDFVVALFSPYGAPFARDEFNEPWLYSNLFGGLALPPLPTTGTYQIVIDPLGAGTGAVTATLSNRVTGALSLTGAGTQVALGRAGQQAELTVAAAAGQRINLGFTGATFAASVTATTRILEPNGSNVLAPNGFPLVLLSIAAGSDYEFTASLAGNYTILFGTTDQSTGSVTVTASPELNAGALSTGAAKTVTISRPGQDARMTFAGTVGQRLSLDFTAYTFVYVPHVIVYRPDGTALGAGSVPSLHLDLPDLPATGTYTIVVSPSSSTGSFTALLSQRQATGTLTTTGPAATVTLAQAGRTADLAFAAIAGQRLSFAFSSWTFAAGTSVRARLFSPSGDLLATYDVGSLATFFFTAQVAGTYRLSLANGTNTGSVAVTLAAEVNGGALTTGTANTVTASRLGQTTLLSFAGTAGQRPSLSFGSYTFTFAVGVTVVRPDGTVFKQGLLEILEYDLDPLPVAGTYQIILSPFAETGSATLTVRQRTDADGRAGLAPITPQLRRAATATSVPAPTLRASARSDRTAARAPAQGGEAWRPDTANLAGTDWYSHRPMSTDPAPPILRAPAGKTAVSGRVLTLDAKPLPGVTVSADGVAGRTDAEGRFLLADLRPGRRVLRVDGASASSPGRVFGLHDIGIDLTAGHTHVLPYTIWLSTLDTEHTVRFPSPTDRDVSITTPAIPGLEVRLPQGAIVRDVTGKVVTELGITAIPLDRSPFPLPRAQVPVYFTVQPGSAYVFPTGARVIYPNFTNAKPGSTMDFWHYEPAGRGWFVYGHGTVTPDGKRVEPDKGTEVYQFTGAMLITPGYDPPPAQAPVPGGGARGGDPVDLGSGLLVDERTDLVVDDVIPLALTRTYQQSDTGRRSFGIGVNSDYDLNLYSENRFVDCWLLLPDGGRVRYHRITPGSTGPGDFLNAAFAADPTPTSFSGSILAWNGNGWDLRMRDGTVYVFGDESPLQEIRDRYGNIVTITRAPVGPDPDGITRAKGPITQVTSANGKWIKFTNDTSGRVTRAEDNIGRTVTYTYHASGHLATVTDANGGVTQYTYASGRLTTIRDARNTVYLTNQYDANGRVSKQTMPDGGTYDFNYVTDSSGRVTETRLTDPRGHVRRVTFNAAGFSTSDTAAFGTGAAQTLQITRAPNTNLPTAYVDALNRRTELTYDAFGNVTSVTELAGTANARTTTIAYGGPFDQVSQLTDPLAHRTIYAYHANGALRTVTDPESRVTTMDTNEAGQVTKVTDNGGNATTYGYVLGDLATVTDPLGRVARWATDGLGRPVRIADPLGNTTRVSYDGFDNVRTVTDPIGRLTSYEYDPNGNLRLVTDPRGNDITYGYDTSDRLTTATDPLARVTSYTYDGNGNVKTATTARGKVTSYVYDELDRLTLVRYGVSGSTSESQVGYTYDAGNRIRSIVDSASGTITLTPDDLDRTIRAVTPQGQVDYAYDKADRRITMTVAGQPAVAYGYDNADQLISINRGTETVAIAYDIAGRRRTVTLPAGVTQTFDYDAASQLTRIRYSRAGLTLGDLTYDYDRAGRPIHVGGAYARANIPATGAGPYGYDATNQRFGRSYDADGNLTSDGTTTYTWNARGELSALSRTGMSMSFSYDGLGRRTSRTQDGATTRFLYDGLNPVQELTGSTVSANLLTGGVDEAFARSTSAGSLSYLTDALGSTVGLIDGAGALVAEYTYGPFGSTTVTGDGRGNRIRFTGREDDFNGLYYYRSRYYEPSAQRFLSADPLGLASGDTNPYSYVFNQPTSLVDPMGTKPSNSRDRCGPGNSFTAGTLVLMADGSTKPIERVRVGDRVAATDPETGERGARTVTATIVGDGDKALIDIRVGDAVITATDGHPVWVDNDGRADTAAGRWIDARELRKGQWLKTAEGRLVQVAGTQARVQHTRVYNLTVDDLHTYYVVSNGRSVLVHNSNDDCRVDYGSINQYGQRSGVRALLDKSFLKGATAPRPQEPIPALRPGGLDNRTHLLAAMFRGSNTDPRNFVAMYGVANNPRMLTVEYEIRRALQAGQQVRYAAVPKYIGNISRPIYIHIRAVGSGPDPLMVNIKIWNVGR
jgi:RHS repeat-associated protein